ncbi:thioesterase family protein [Fodinicurvata sp. EGI_FJ10296]|uniref:acyl-CoA thioesterase n=1 Tax=Fodinicurvata sp. EGI_FJ10296 TaxID=3231908 RepID=UPI0034542F5E
MSTTPVGTSYYKVCFGDTDAGGVVYHARYFEMAERGRNALMEEFGVPVGPLFDDREIALVLRRASLEFIKFARYDENLRLETGILKTNPARTRWRTSIFNARTLLCKVDVEIVCIDRKSKTLIPAPSDLADVFQRLPEARP